MLEKTPSLRRLWGQYRVAIAEAKAELDRLRDAISRAENDLVDAVPTTFAGAIAGKRYLAACKAGWINSRTKSCERLPMG